MKRRGLTLKLYGNEAMYQLGGEIQWFIGKWNRSWSEASWTPPSQFSNWLHHCNSNYTLRVA